MAKKLSVDIVEQAALGKEVPPENDVIKAVFENLCQAAEALHARGDRRGALIVIGKYASAGEVPKARGDLRPTPFKGQYVSVGDKYFQRMILQGAVGEGAVVADESGQILGGGIMLAIDNYGVEVPPGGFMRHTAAAATSLRKEVMAVITLSEENNIARVFQNGKVMSAYDPAAREEDVQEQAPADEPPEQATPEPQSTAQTAGEATQVVPPPGRKKAKRTTSRKRKKKSDRSTRSTQTGIKASDASKDKKRERSDIEGEDPAAFDGEGGPDEEEEPT